MKLRIISAFLLLCLSSRPDAFELRQGAVQDSTMRARVLDALFPFETGTRAYFSRMVLRFDDSNSQLTVVVLPGGKSEVIRQRLVGVSRADLERLVSRQIAGKPAVTPQEIASNLKVDTARVTVDYDRLLAPLIAELQAIRVSPTLPGRLSVDDYSEYRFAYDISQMSVRYTIVSPFQDEPVDELGRWMTRFRAQSEEWFTSSKKN